MSVNQPHHQEVADSCLCRQSGWRIPPTRLVIMFVFALAGSLAFVNFVLVMISDRMNSPPYGNGDSRSVPSGLSDAEESKQFQLPASYVRVESQSSSGSGRVKLVLSVDMTDLSDLIDAYRNGFAPIKERYPDEGGILMHNREICRQPRRGQTGHRPINWIVFVHSAPTHANRRQMLRDTWANLGLFKDLEFRVVFLIGRLATEDTDLEAELKTEFDKHGDLIQGNFIDSYKNMTLKAVMGLRWLAEFCPEAPYAIKADDDTFLNIFEIIPMMTANANQPHVIICPLWPDNRMPILRDPKTCMKWCVRKRELRGRTHFPQYCAGIGYVISRRLVPMLYNASRSTPFFWIDDVYVTGLLTQKLSVKPTFIDVLSHFSAHDARAVDQYTNLTQPMTYWYVHAKNEDNFWTMWKFLMKRLTAHQRQMISADVLKRWSSE